MHGLCEWCWLNLMSCYIFIWMFFVVCSCRPLYLKVKDLAYELQQKGGPISVLSDVAQVFGLTGMKTVSVSKVEREVSCCSVGACCKVT